MSTRAAPSLACLAAAAAVLVGGAAPAAARTPFAVAGECPAPLADGSAAKKCKPGYVLRKLRAKEGKRKRTVTRCCRRGYALRQYRTKVRGRTRYSYRCVKPKRPATTPTPAPAPAPAPAPTPAPQQDPKERLAQLLRGRKLIYFSASTVGDVSGSTERLISFCVNGTFNYRYQYSGTFSFTEQYASGTWQVEEAVFNDAQGTAQGRVSYVSNNPDVLASGQILLEIVGERVYLDGTEYAVEAGSC